MKDRITKLLSVKSLVTLTITAVVAYLAITGVIPEDAIMNIFATVIAFYFGTRVGKDEEKSETVYQIDPSMLIDNTNAIGFSADDETEEE